MNRTLKTLPVLFLLVTIFLLSSCKDNDGYDFNPYKTELATVNIVDSLVGSYYLTLNNGSTLWPAVSNVKYKPLNNQRALVNYTVLTDSSVEYTHNIRVNSISNISTKQIEVTTNDNNSQFGDDPIKVMTIGIGDNYLNIRYEIKISGEEINHSINLVTKDFKASNDTLELELRHNANNDTPLYGKVNYIAFDLRTIQQKDRDHTFLKVKTIDYSNKIQEYTLQYKY